LRAIGDIFEECDTHSGDNHDEKMDVDEIEGFITSTERVNLVVEAIVAGKD